MSSTIWWGLGGLAAFVLGYYAYKRIVEQQQSLDQARWNEGCRDGASVAARGDSLLQSTLDSKPRDFGPWGEGFIECYRSHGGKVEVGSTARSSSLWRLRAPLSVRLVS